MRIFKDLTIRTRMPQSIATRWQLFIYLIISQALQNVNRDLHFAALCQCRITIDKLQRKKRIANESQMCYS